MRILVSVLLVAGASAACGKLIGPDADGVPPDASPDAGQDATDDAQLPGPGPGPAPDAGPVDAAHEDAHGPDAPKRLVFLSAKLAPGNLDFGDAMTGVAGADAECTTEASLSGLNTPFVAWVSTSMVNAIDRLTDGPPWALRDGTVVFASRAAVASSMLQAEIDRGATGAVVIPNNGGVWTGTLANGTRAPTRCADWTSTGMTAFGHVGAVGATDGAWTSDGTQNAASCSSQYHVICFEK